LWKRWVISLEWKAKEVTDKEIEVWDCDEVICTKWGEPGGESYTVCPKKVTPLNIWRWQVQTCTALHIIKRAQALMYLEYRYQILYKSVVPFSRFSIFTKRCQKVQLPAALLASFLCALTVFYINAQHFSFNAICWYFICCTYQADFYWSSCEGKWFVLPVDYAIWGILKERVYRCQIGDVDHLKERLIYELCHFDQPIIDRAVVQ